MTLFPTDRWTKDVETLRGDTFFHATPGDRPGEWRIGVGYWCRDGGWAGATYGRTGEEARAIWFHPFPEPPHG